MATFSEMMNKRYVERVMEISDRLRRLADQFEGDALNIRPEDDLPYMAAARDGIRLIQQGTWDIPDSLIHAAMPVEVALHFEANREGRDVRTSTEATASEPEASPSSEESNSQSSSA